MDKKNRSISRVGLISIIVIFLLLFSSLTWAQDNIQTKTEYGSTVTISGPVQVPPGHSYGINLDAVTDAPIFQWSLLEDGNYIAGSGFTWGNTLHQTHSFTKAADGSHMYLFRFRGIAGAHGWPPYTEVSITVNIVTPSPLWAYKVTGPDNSTTVEANTNQVVYFELDATAPDYVWGNILALYDTSKLESVSIEENPYSWGFWTWWTPATNNPAYYGGGNYYYYDQIINSGIFGLGSAWARQWVDWYGDGHAGPVGTIDPFYGQALPDKQALADRLGISLADVDNLGAIRLYTSTYAGGMYGNSPLRLGFRVLAHGTTSFHTFADGSPDSPIRYEWYWNHLDSYLKSEVELLPPPDNTPPTGSIVIQDNAQYISTPVVTLTLSAGDPESGVTSMRFSNDAASWFGWEPYAPTKDWTLSEGDGLKNVYVEYQNGAGLISQFSDTITLDTTPSEIIIYTPVSGYTYTVADVIPISYLVLDDISGVIFEEATINDLPVENNTQVNAIQLQIGENTFKVIAYNGVDLMAETSVTFNIMVTADGIQEVITQFYEDGQITNYGIYNSLISQAEAVENSLNQWQTQTAINQMDAMINHIEAQSDKFIAETAASLLVSYIGNLQLRTSLPTDITLYLPTEWVIGGLFLGPNDISFQLPDGTMVKTTLSGQLTVRIEPTANPSLASIRVLSSDIIGTPLTIQGVSSGPLYFSEQPGNPSVGTLNMDTGWTHLTSKRFVTCNYFTNLPFETSLNGFLSPLNLTDGMFYLIDSGMLPDTVPYLGGSLYTAQSTDSAKNATKAPLSTWGARKPNDEVFGSIIITKTDCSIVYEIVQTHEVITLTKWAIVDGTHSGNKFTSNLYQAIVREAGPEKFSGKIVIIDFVSNTGCEIDFIQGISTTALLNGSPVTIRNPQGGTVIGNPSWTPDTPTSSTDPTYGATISRTSRNPLFLYDTPGASSALTGAVYDANGDSINPNDLVGKTLTINYQFYTYIVCKTHYQILGYYRWGFTIKYRFTKDANGRVVATPTKPDPSPESGTSGVPKKDSDARKAYDSITKDYPDYKIK